MTDNPYSAPTNGIGSPDTARKTNWSILPVSVLVVLNLVIVVFANSSLAVLTEFGIDLSSTSQVAYVFASNKVVAIVSLLAAAITTIVTCSIVSDRLPKQARKSSLLAIAFWITFTFSFAYAILLPLYSVITGLTE